MSHNLTSSPNLSKPVRCCIGIAAGTASDAHPTRMHPTCARGQHGLSSAQASQRGVALVVALILMVVLTLVGLAAVRGTIMQQKMTSNFSDRQIAFQVGEAGLRQAQIVVQGLSTPISTAALPATIRNCSPASGNKCLANPLTDTGLPAADIQTVTAALFAKGNMAAGQPKYVIEYMGNFNAPAPTVQQLSGCSGYAPCGLSNTADYYRITVSSGPAAAGTDRATVTLQSMFRR
jgi:type IV pilus assembly protein PilX